MKTKNIILIALVLLACAAAFAWYQYSRGHVDLADVKPDFMVKSETLHEDFAADEAAASKLYLGKIVAVTGQVKSVQENGDVTIVSVQASDMGDILCSMAKGVNISVAEGEVITLVGECTGALGDTDLGMLDVNLVRCIKK